MSELSESNSLLNKPAKTKEEYSRNVKKLKLKLQYVQYEIEEVEKKMRIYANTSNDKMIALRIAKFCKQRRMTPEMIFRCADKARKKTVTKAAFRETLVSLGIKLTQQEMTRLEYLLDQDISGEISYGEYDSYLNAFNIKGEYSPSENILKDIFKKIDLKKLEDSQDPEVKLKQLLNYEEFIKYCHRNLPHLKDKQIANIFNRLQKNNLIDLDEFIKYLKKREQQNKRNERRNISKKLDKKDQDLGNPNELKTIIQLILRNRPKDSKAQFHSIEFAKVERALNKKRGELLQIFKQIDKKRKGSFSFIELIQFYIEKQKSRKLEYVYELMGRKYLIDNEKPEDALNRYNDNGSAVKIQQFRNFMSKEFSINEVQSELVFRAIAKNNNQITVRQILDAMKLEHGQKRVLYIKPTFWKTSPKDFWRKQKFTILFNPLVALRFCLQIQEELNKAKQIFWDDFEFGPTLEDPVGADSLKMDNIEADSVKWLTVQSLGMTEFYYSNNESGCKSSPACPHEIFSLKLQELAKQNPTFLYNKRRADQNQIKKVQEQHLLHLFQGTYPLAFHNFVQHGIYVFRFYVREKWAYVLVDNKIPCDQNSEPLFSYSGDRRYAWISLIEKAYAKVKGSYANMFSVGSNEQYIHEMSRKLPVLEQMPRVLANEAEKNKLWEQLLSIEAGLKSNKHGEKFYCMASQPQGLTQAKVQTGFIKNALVQVANLVEINDQKCSNSHKSHRLVVLRNTTTRNDTVWNPNWCNDDDTSNKYDNFLTTIDSELKAKSSQVAVLKDKNIAILNYKLMRSIFDRVYTMRKVHFDEMIVLRKVIEFEEKFACRYELASKQPANQPFNMIVTLNKIRGPKDAEIEFVMKDATGKQLKKKSTNKNFATLEFQLTPQTTAMEIKTSKYIEGAEYIYCLTFYMQGPLYSLKELDRQLLFKYLSPYEEMYYLDISQADQKERRYIYSNYYKAAERSAGCCG